MFKIDNKFYLTASATFALVAIASFLFGLYLFLGKTAEYGCTGAALVGFGLALFFLLVALGCFSEKPSTNNWWIAAGVAFAAFLLFGYLAITTELQQIW